MFKKSLLSLFCILHPACVLLSVCGLHCTLSLHFTPGPQSAVCSPQSSFYTDRFLNFLKGKAHFNSVFDHLLTKDSPRRIKVYIRLM